MKNSTVLGIIVVLIIIGGIAYYALQHDNDADHMMTQGTNTMSQDEMMATSSDDSMMSTSSEDTMMQGDDSMMLDASTSAHVMAQ